MKAARFQFAEDRIEVAAIPLILRRAIEKKEAEVEHLRSVLASIESLVSPAPARRVAKKPSRRVAKPARAPKKSKKSPPPQLKRKVTKAKKAAASDDFAPRTVKGQMPRVGVQQTYCATLKETQAAVGERKKLGYERVGPGVPLAAGTYDVRPTGDEDDSNVVLWREKVPEVVSE